MTDDIGNVIATASLLLAVITVLMSLWYAEVTRAIGEEEPELPYEKITLGKNIAPIFWSKALPLALGSSIMAVIFLRRAEKIVVEAVGSMGTSAQYDDMKAAFVATETLMLLLAIVTISLAWQLGAKRRRMR